MNKTNIYNMFIENRLVMQGGERPSVRPSSIDEIDAILRGGTEAAKKDHAEAAKDEAKRELDKRQVAAFEQARQKSVEEATREIFKVIKKVEKDRVVLDRLANSNKATPVALRVATGFILDIADKIGARGTGRNKIQKPSIQQGGDLSAMVSAVMENLLYNEFRIDDVTNASQFDNIQTTLERVSKRGQGAAGRNEVWSRYNKFAALSGAIDKMKGEFA